MVNGFRYYRALESVRVSFVYRSYHLPNARSESINAGSLNSNFLKLGRRSGGRPQRTVHLMRLPVNTVIHTTLVDLEPVTFRSLVDCWSDALQVVPHTHRKTILTCNVPTSTLRFRFSRAMLCISQSILSHDVRLSVCHYPMLCQAKSPRI